MTTQVRPKTRLAGAAVLIGMASVSMLLAGCTSPEPVPEPTPSITQTESTPVPDPQLNPEGSASDNRAYFDFVNQRTIAADPQAGGQAFTSALRDAGFPIADMQVTVDITTVGVKADSLQFSVLWKGECLMGQYGFGQYTSAVMPVLGTGKCMVGETRPIDW